MLGTDDEAIACLTAFARRERLSASQFTAIGAFRRTVLGYLEWERKDYRRNPIEEQVEVASLVSDVALGEGGERPRLLGQPRRCPERPTALQLGCGDKSGHRERS